MPESPANVTRDLHLLTIDSLLADLVSGRSVSVAGGGTLYIDSDDARAVLDWYRRNPSKWAGNLTAGDAEAIVNTIGLTPPSFDAPSIASSNSEVVKLRLHKLTAHRFAGLHAFGKSNEPPSTFTFIPTEDITLLEGANGSGKTSIINAMVWCLTGRLLRSQREPEKGPVEFLCDVATETTGLSTYKMSAVTPMPHAGSDLPSEGKPILADTWVEIILVDEAGNLLPPLKREQKRTDRGKIIETPPNLEGIGIDPIAWRVATTMPALLPFLTVGSTSQLGQAVARLTGLADLVDMAKHATKAADRVSKRMVKELEIHKDDKKSQFDQVVADFNSLREQSPQVAESDPAPNIDDEESDEKLEALKVFFSSEKETALSAAQGVLGDTFDPEDKGNRGELEEKIHPAKEQLRQARTLPSLARLVGFLSVDEEAIRTAKGFLNKIILEAETLVSIISNPEQASRVQLYAKICDWAHNSRYSISEECPVCTTALDGKEDKVTGRPIRDHFDEADADREVLSKSIDQWAQHWLGVLMSDLPEVLTTEMRKELPTSPSELMRTAFSQELFQTEGFLGVLSGIRGDVSSLIDEEVEKLPLFSNPEDITLPATLLPHVQTLNKGLKRLSRALEFCSWTTLHREALRKCQVAIVKGSDDTDDRNCSIGAKLGELSTIVEGVAPLNSALELVARMVKSKAEYEKVISRIRNCLSAAAALEKIIPLGALAQDQVDELRIVLHERAEYWRSKVYMNATEFAPDLTGSEMDSKGVLDLKVGRQGFTAPAQHISNASALRGALLGFFLAFREHVLQQRGGLSLLLLDDPQDLLDKDNKVRLARGLSALAEEDTQLVVTSHDRNFASSFVSENRSSNKIQHLSVHPVNSVCPVLKLSPSVEEVDRKKNVFKSNPDSAASAQDYASDLRVYLEARIGDLFDSGFNPAYASSTQAPTLIPLLDKLRSLISTNSGELFGNLIVRSFANDPALAEGAEARRILNQSHHDKASITYMDVKSVESDFVRLRRDVDKVHEQFRLHRWREPLLQAEHTPSNVTSLSVMEKPEFEVPLYPDLAAFIASAGVESQEVQTEMQTSDWFDDKSLYYIRGESLGLSIPSGSIAVVESEPYAGRDQNLVIARQNGKIYARRLIRSRDAVGISLSAEIPDPRRRRSTLTFDEDKLCLHRIVGVIFSDRQPPDGRHEAGQVDAAPELGDVQIAYRVRAESAVPLALPDQIVLAGSEIPVSNLDTCFGKVIAVSLNDGSCVLKRMGGVLSSRHRHLRQLETIGGLGSSLVVSTEELEEDPDIPVIIAARQVIGVMYDT